MKYGGTEYKYAAPIADALVGDPAFRKWFISRTEFAALADNAHLMHEEMRSYRRSKTAEWWRFHFTEKCRCRGCSGKETDIFAVFESTSKVRFATHIEVKHPADRFKEDGVQSMGYPLRAKCWVANPPVNVLSHHQATSVLLFSEASRESFAPHLPCFETLITFEEIEKEFPTVMGAIHGLSAAR